MTLKKFFLLLAAFSCIFLLSCRKEDPNRKRPQFIEVYTSMEDLENPQKTPVSSIGIDVRGGENTIFVKSNVEFNVAWQDALFTPWARVTGCETVSSNPFVTKLTFEASRLDTRACYGRRTGTLLLSCPSVNYAVYIRVSQGLSTRLFCDFSNLVYGYPDPLNEIGERAFDEWSATVRDTYKFTSEPSVSAGKSCLYGKSGFVKLGDGMGHGAEITTWQEDNFEGDSLLMVSFNAVAYTDAEGKKDSGKFSLEVIGGGVIRDNLNSTSINLTASGYDANGPGYPNSIWNESGFLVFITGTKDNPVTKDTKIRIASGSLTNEGENSRLFLDNLAIRPVNLDMNEDYFSLNGGSGRDRILWNSDRTNE